MTLNINIYYEKYLQFIYFFKFYRRSVSQMTPYVFVLEHYELMQRYLTHNILYLFNFYFIKYTEFFFNDNSVRHIFKRINQYTCII